MWVMVTVIFTILRMHIWALEFTGGFYIGYLFLHA